MMFSLISKLHKEALSVIVETSQRESSGNESIVLIQNEGLFVFAPTK
jgi:hypothetical protein